MNKLRLILQITIARSTVISSIQVGLVVGIILNLINQWNALLALNYHLFNLPKLILTFMVPYLVSTYATIKAKM